MNREVIASKWSHRLSDGRFQCDLCPRYCKMRPGQRGFCYIREAREDGVYLTSYGRASGFCIDPIEKKPLNHFYPGSSVMSFGTAGCNLGCKFCQNWSISKARATNGMTEWASPRDIATATAEAGCKSIAFTYNDPVIFAEFAIDCALAAKEKEIKTVAVTAGYITELARGPFFQHIDAANVDLKAFTETFYRKLCFASIQPVLDTLKWLKEETDVWFEVTTLIIPGQNDSHDEMARLCEWFMENLGGDVPLHFSAFHPDFKMMDIPRTPAHTLQRARRQALEAGLKYVYTGNISDPNGQSTYCTGCGQRIIERSGYTIGEWRIDKTGACRDCRTPVAGHFLETPGNWGSRRIGIQI